MGCCLMDTPLGRMQGQAATDPADIEAMRRRAWTEQGIVVIRPDDIADPWCRQVVIQEAETRFGKRRLR